MYCDPLKVDDYRLVDWCVSDEHAESDMADPANWRAAAYERAATRPCIENGSLSAGGYYVRTGPPGCWVELHCAGASAFGRVAYGRCPPRPDVPR